MSIYKGNQLISGHQVLYSETGTNTDGAMTQAATTQALDTKANADDVYTKTATDSTFIKRDEVWYDGSSHTLYIGVPQNG